MAVETVRIGVMRLPAEYGPVAAPLGMVVCVRGGERGRARLRQLAAVLQGYRLSTLRLEWPGPTDAAAEAPQRLAGHLGDALDWLQGRPEAGPTLLGLYGAGAGAAAVLHAAAERPGQVAAVVAKSGRAELVATPLAGVLAPTLLIVGANDAAALAPNREAMRRLHGKKRLEVVPGAGPRFEEPGALDAVAQLAGAWFATHLADPRRR